MITVYRQLLSQARCRPKNQPRITLMNENRSVSLLLKRRLPPQRMMTTLCEPVRLVADVSQQAASTSMIQ
ncbi:MAG: hypothetical protein DWQ34_16495 [Planctomycetota bacterium]|nr:MAG: hypothetical protein DWQ34_16495 [Planctomycetota bacterium]REK24291.1 MAG: hypothetical protein DWQ41_14780 [Planctomycetota bacterium]